MSQITRTILIIALLISISACSNTPDANTNNTDVNNADADHSDVAQNDAGNQDTDANKSDIGQQDANKSDAENNDTKDEEIDSNVPDDLPKECTVTLEISDSFLTIPTTWPTPITANTRPLICWETPQGVSLPATENGWELVVQREDKASEDLESSEWRTTLLPIETRQIHYGNCDLQPTNCTTAADLTPGTYFIHILEPNNPTGPAASLVLTVE